MPYIKKTDDRRISLQLGETALSAGELNYQIFYYVKHNMTTTPLPKVLMDIFKFVDNFLGERPNYQKYNDMTGALVCCRKELIRRGVLKEQDSEFLVKVLNEYDGQIGRYEDLKIIENGDVE